jgi:DNA-directed RNA polymerase specialized sigma24 family protein
MQTTNVRQILINQFSHGLSAEDKEDLTQEIDIALWKCEKEYDPIRNPNKEAVLWIFGKSACLNYIKKTKRYNERYILSEEIDYENIPNEPYPHYSFLTETENKYIPYIIGDITIKKLAEQLGISIRWAYTNGVLIKDKIRLNLKGE